MEIWTVSYAICRMIWSTVRVSVVLAAMGAGQIWMDGNGKLLKWLSNNSFNFYFLHMQLTVHISISRIITNVIDAITFIKKADTLNVFQYFLVNS